MAVERIEIDEFLEYATLYPVLDVRSPGEFNHAHIPGAINLALFSDDERKVVGTAYKQAGRQQAIRLGLDYFGPRMRSIVEEVEKIIQSRVSARGEVQNTVLVHCWRGGMRSGAIAWLLDLYGFRVYTLAGGYKRFRNHVLAAFSTTYEFSLIGGFTGSGKTPILKEIARRGEIAIDLEALASHKGSAFGALGMPKQPSQEMFENLLAVELIRAAKRASERNLLLDNGTFRIWLEDESQRIGTVNIPQPLWQTMRAAPVFFIDIPFDQRLDHIIREYGKLDMERIVNAIIRIKKRLGGLETKTAINALLEGDVAGGFTVLLNYYDKYYLKGLHSRPELDSILFKITAEKVDAEENANKIVNAYKSIHARY